MREVGSVKKILLGFVTLGFSPVKRGETEKRNGDMRGEWINHRKDKNRRDKMRGGLPPLLPSRS